MRRHSTAAIIVALEEEKLTIRGLYSAGRGAEYWKRPYSSFLEYDRSLPEQALHIDVPGAGCLEIWGRYRVVARLSGGAIYPDNGNEPGKYKIIDHPDAELFQGKCSQAGDRAAALVLPSGPARCEAEGNAASLYSGFVACVLAGIRGSRHGGTLALISGQPEGLKDGYYKLKPRPDRVLRVIGERSSKSIHEGSTGHRPEPDLSEHLELRDEWLDLIDSVVGMASVDGVVVLNYDLDFVGFSGFVEKLGSNGNEQPGNRGGARKQSALSLAKKNKESTVFAVSQDGDITAYYNRGSNEEIYPVEIEPGILDYGLP